MFLLATTAPRCDKAFVADVAAKILVFIYSLFMKANFLPATPATNYSVKEKTESIKTLRLAYIVF